MVFVSGNIDFHNLQFLENGWIPILTTAFSMTTFFPFVEMFIFSMLSPHLNRPESTKTVWLSAMISSGLVLTYTTSLNIVVLDAGEVERSTFPLLSTIGKVSLFEFIQRLDAIAVLTFLFTTCFKVSIYFWCSHRNDRFVQVKKPSTNCVTNRDYYRIFINDHRFKFC
ncbi:GerAB/ArcD/ProY family transporter [Bacillus sp. ISL-7]|uniref:GerAB/ArcD/ProY family transporter n=1 Tax=Bacillus sp. ISL-7 TaxID=2819136 RepID=UPI002034C3BA|nr:GerAB/ArcD/ProY family transporter [Bacillus sp. ISL-7]